MPQPQLRLLILGAHPDDAEFHAGGLASIYHRRGHVVRMVSVTDGGAGHHLHDRQQLVQVRRAEALAAGAIIGSEYPTWDFPDGSLMPTLDLRERIIEEIRTFKPDLVLTHRVNDYHPDHRAVGQAVQDASYLVTVPLVVPHVPILKKDPVVAYMVDLFTKPTPLQPDVVIDIEPELDTMAALLACHRSQVYEFLPYNHGHADAVPENDDAKQTWLREWFSECVRPRSERFRERLIAEFGPERGREIQYVEAYEISEYASSLSDEMRGRLFPTRSAE